MLSKDEQQAYISVLQEKKIPFGIKVAKVCLEVAVAAGVVYVAATQGKEAAQCIDQITHAHEPLKNVIDFSRGEILTFFVAAPAYILGTIGCIEHAVKERYGRLR
ncbi:hypothetical protein COV19_01340 [Candidatus Woesearchaeota archaeon CG10_big_fil_rev_8_21_14_0_10_44_13]|nr:MAG: hypothetical protein COV19_01340 [Candidatus Woesearchaeota archaeon CG10_big_fil_rev_8_21_14_0_10_44_13]